MDNILEHELNRYLSTKKELEDKIKFLEECIQKQLEYIKEENNKNSNRRNIINDYTLEIEKLKNKLKCLYFGKIEYKKNDDDSIQEIYVCNDTISINNNIISYDWRNDTSSVFYSDSVKVVNKYLFDTTSNEFKIVDSLPDSYPIYTKMTNEQNDIIRNNYSHNTMVIGDCNTGKTSTLINRLSTILYKDKDIRPSNVLIIGKDSDYFDSIDSSLKELKLDDVSKLTYNDLFLKSFKKVNKSLRITDNYNEYDAYKNSVSFLEKLDKFVEAYFIGHLDKPIVFNNVEICKSEKLVYIYKNSLLRFTSYAERVNTFIKNNSKFIKEVSDDFCDKVWKVNYREEFLSLPKDSPRRKEIISIKEKNDKIIKSGCVNVLKDYFNFIKVSPITLYETFISTIDHFDPDIPNICEFKNNTLNNIKNNNMNSYDLAAIMYINYLINGINIQDNYNYIFIDDCDKFSETQLFLLKKMFPSAIFNIFTKNKINSFSDVKIDYFELDKPFIKKEKTVKEKFEEVEIEIVEEKPILVEESKTEDATIIEEETKTEEIPVIEEESKHEEVPVIDKELFTKISVVPTYAIKDTNVLILDDDNIVSTGEYEINTEFLNYLINNSQEEYVMIRSSQFVEKCKSSDENIQKIKK